MSIYAIIFYLLLIDSLGANLVTWFGGKWYTKHFRLLSRYFPAVKGWTTYYMVLVLFIGYLMYITGLL